MRKLLIGACSLLLGVLLVAGVFAHAPRAPQTSAVETDSVVGAVTGIVEADGGGNISAATAGTDYLTPAGIGAAYDTEGELDTLFNARALEAVVGVSLGNGMRLEGTALTSDRFMSTLDIVAGDETPVAITTANVIANRYVTNQGSSSEADWTVPDIEYYVNIIFIVNEEFIEEICPPNADAHEAFDLDGTALDLSDCIDSSAVVGSKMSATRMQIDDGTWKWSFDTIRGVWIDRGASD